MIDWKDTEASGIYTFGGKGCYLYGLKYAITQVFGTKSRYQGLRKDGKVLVFQQGHYAKNTTADWVGLGMDIINTNNGKNEMDLEHLEENMAYYHSNGIPIVCIILYHGNH